MTGMERLEETIKIPEIAARGLFDRMPALQRDESRRLDANGAPVTTVAEQFSAARNQL